MPIRNLGLIAICAACATGPADKMDRGEAEFAEASKVEVCSAALETVSREAEKQYRAALSAPATAPVRRQGRATRPVESANARRALTNLELVLVQAPTDDSLDRSARRVAGAAEALLLRAREPARRSDVDGHPEQTASLQALLATHELFEKAAAHLRAEVEQTVRSGALTEATQARPVPARLH